MDNVKARNLKKGKVNTYMNESPDSPLRAQYATYNFLLKRNL